MAAALLASCAATTKQPVWREPPSQWGYKTDSGVGLKDGPMALYGPPETLAYLTLSCDRAAGALELATLDSDLFEGDRPIAMEAGGVRWSGTERLDPPDLVAVARASIPLDHPVVGALAQGATPLIISGASGKPSSIPNDALIGRVIRECREPPPG